MPATNLDDSEPVIVQSQPPKLSGISATLLANSIDSLLDISVHKPSVHQDQNTTVAKSTSSVRDYTSANSEKVSVDDSHGVLGSSTFGSRLLTDPSKIDDFNAWDHVEWDDAHILAAEERIKFHAQNPVPEGDLKQYEDDVAHTHWDEFYVTHDHKFFKDRKWINLEFPELIDCCTETAGPMVICDVGCAVGNTVFPLLRQNRNPDLVIHALDYSAEAIKIVQSNEEYDSEIVNAGVWDMADCRGPPSNIPEGSVNLIVLIFAFSALSPKQWPQALSNMWRLLKPGGQLLLRDYGRYDLTQLRLKSGRLLSENLYIRGDGTRVYYFTNSELATIFSTQKGWQITQNAIDKRLLVNRKENKRMYRAWIQLKATKIATVIQQ